MKLVCGVGVNDADYFVQVYDFVHGKKKRVWICPFYMKWNSMLTRCYNKRYQSDKPSYEEFKVAAEWHYFMAFRSWMEKQNWEGKHLDKDLLVSGNKVYTPDTCCFIPNEINVALSTNKKRGYDKELPTGIFFEKESGKYLVQMSKFGKNKKIGRFKTLEEATLVYKNERESYVKQLADKYKLEIDEKAYLALVSYKE